MSDKNRGDGATSGVSDFVSLTDTPAAYAGHGLKNVRVNAGATALEFVTPFAITQATHTPTGSWNSGCTYEGRYFLIGDLCHWYVQILCSGAVTATTLTVNLPAGINVDTSKLFTPGTGAPFPMGYAGIMDTGTAYYVGAVVFETASAVRLFAQPASGAYTSGAQVSNTVPHTFANTDRVMFQATFPWVAV